MRSSAFIVEKHKGLGMERPNPLFIFAAFPLR